jgi:hypothetical protein
MNMAKQSKRSLFKKSSAKTFVYAEAVLLGPRSPGGIKSFFATFFSKKVALTSSPFAV